MKRTYIPLILLTIIFIIVYVFTFNSKLDLNGDNTRYLRLAENISSGFGYNNISPNGVKPETHFPPGYPFFLSFFMLFGIHSLIFFKILNGMLFLGSLVLIYKIVKNTTQNIPLAFVVSLLPIFSPRLLHFSNIVMSEMLFMFLTILCLYCLHRYRLKNPHPFWKSPWFYVSILSAVASYYVRAVGLAMIFGALVFFLMKKEWKQSLGFLGGTILLMLPWFFRNRNINSESRYVDAILSVNHWRPEEGTINSVGDLIAKLAKNFDEAIIKGCKDVLFPFWNIDYANPSGTGGILIGILLLAVIFYGAWRLQTIRWGVIAYLIGSIIMVIIGTTGNESRYIIPLIPLLFAGFYIGLYCLIRKWVVKKESKFSYSLPYSLLLLAFMMISPVKAEAERAKEPYPNAYENYFAIAREMQKQLPEGTICCCRKPELFGYYAPKIYATNYLYSTDPNEVIKDLIKKNVDYVILEQLGYGSTPRYLYSAIQENMELFPVAWHLQKPDTYLLKFERKKAIEKFGENE
ncbi:MAG: glycosyltransferase family 39 protein [Candidatus Azobacteroides sp.]|nr:glycosyltransferase family 39 protein [Candidatus Azobacteroides sp.]